MSDDERPAAKTLTIGVNVFRISETEAPVCFTDVVTEDKVIDGIVYFSFGTSFSDGANGPEIVINSRHRMSVVSAQILRDALTNLIDRATKPADQSKAN